MKKAIIMVTTMAMGCINTNAQFVGIGTNSPQTTLDVKGNFRIGGASKFLQFDSVTGKFIWSNTNLFIPTAQYIIQHSASAEGLYYANGQMEYRNQLGEPAFFSNWQNGNGFFKGKLGIGTTTPSSPLHVFGMESSPNGLGAGIQISNHANGSNFNNWLLRAGATGTNTPAGGFSISDNNGYWFNITPDGYIGLSTITPRSPLSFAPATGSKINLWDDGNVNGDHYGLGIQPGLFQLYSYTANDDIAFGFGNSNAFNEQFRIKGSGALAVQGNAGLPGQALISNGNAIAPVWKNQPQYFFFERTYGGTPLNLQGSYVPVTPIDNQSFVLNFNARLIITISAQVYTDPAEPAIQEPNFFFQLFLGSLPVLHPLEGYESIRPQPATYISTDLTVTRYTSIMPPGTYTLDFNISNVSASGICKMGGAQVIIQAIPN